MKQETVNTMPEPARNATFHQKSAGVSLVAITAVTVGYIASAWMLRQSGTAVPTDYLRQMGYSFLWLIVIEIALQTVLVIGSGRSERSTADRQAALTGTRNAYYTLVTGLFAALGSAVLNADLVLSGNLLLLGFLLAEIVRYVSQLVYYRRAD